MAERRIQTTKSDAEVVTGKVALPGGGWAVLIDPADMPEYQRRPIKLKMVETQSGVTVDVQGEVDTAAKPGQSAFGAPPSADESPAQSVKLSGDAMGGMLEVFDLLTVAIIEEWSYDQEVTVENLMRLPGRAYNALNLHGQAAMDSLFPDYGVNPEPDSPT